MLTLGRAVPWLPARQRITGDEVALFDEEGGSNISGPDFAAAIVDEIERPTRHRAHMSVAY